MNAKERSHSGPDGERQREIEKLEKDVEDLKRLAGSGDADTDLERVRQEVAELRREFYAHLGPWQRAQIARHQQRPYLLDFVQFLFTDFMEIHGDRAFGDDKAIICGFAKFHGRPVAVIGHQKGRDTKQRVMRNFGQPKPEGQGEAIARNLREMARLPVPVIVTVTGEGGSGGALAVAVGDRVNILENSFYSVISPEGCAAIMWRDSTKAETAAEAMKITAKDLKDFGIVDEIVREPDGGAHTDHEAAAKLLADVIERQLAELTLDRPQKLIDARYEKFRKMGQFFDIQ